MTKLTQDQQVKRIIDQEILANQTMLVDHLLSGYDEANEFSIEDITNFYDDSIETRKQYLLDNNIDLTVYMYDYDIESEKDLTDEDYIYLSDDYGFEPEPQEIFQWYLVTDWLADKLKEIGEPVLDNDYGQWWGRTCCGQYIEMDGTIQTIVTNLN